MASAYVARAGRKPAPKKAVLRPGRTSVGSNLKPGASGLGLKPGSTSVGTGLKAKLTGGTQAPARPKPGLGAAAPDAPKAPAAPKPVVAQQMEPDAPYLNNVDAIDRRSQERLGELEGSESNIRREFGIEDPSDPFSRMEGLKRAFLSRQKAASAGLASQGQLYSGAHERALGRTRRQEEQARSELYNSYRGAMDQITQAKRGVAWESEEDKRRAFEDWLARAPKADVDITQGDADAGALADAAPAPDQPQGGGRPVSGSGAAAPSPNFGLPGNPASIKTSAGTAALRDPFAAPAKPRGFVAGKTTVGSNILKQVKPKPKTPVKKKGR